MDTSHLLIDSRRSVNKLQASYFCLLLGFPSKYLYIFVAIQYKNGRCKTMDDTKDTKDIKETGEAASVLSADEQMIQDGSMRC